MKMSLYYESNFKSDYIWLDVPDEAEFSEMIERDYQERLSRAKPGKTVKRRTPQEILDETSREIYNSHHYAERNSVSYEILDPYGKRFSDSDDPLELLIEKEEKEELHSALCRLQPQQRELLKKLFWDQLSQQEIADAEGVRKSSLSERKRWALKALKKSLKKNI